MMGPLFFWPKMNNKLGKIILATLITASLKGEILHIFDTKIHWNNGQQVGVETESFPGSMRIQSDDAFFRSDEFNSGFLSHFWQNYSAGLHFAFPNLLYLANGSAEGVPNGIATQIKPAPARMEAEIHFSAGFNTRGGGLYFHDGTNFVTAFLTNQIIGSKRNGQSATFHGGPVSSVFLKIQKDNDTFRTFFNVGSGWTLMEVYGITMANFRVGLGSIVAHSHIQEGAYDYFRCSPYFQTGTWASQAISLTSKPTTIGELSWEQDLPAGTAIQMQTSTSPDGSNWSAWSPPLTSNFGSTIPSPPQKYLRVHATLFSDSTKLVTPTLNKLTIKYPSTVPGQPLVWSDSHASARWSSANPLQLKWSMPAGNPAPESQYTYWNFSNGSGVTLSSETIDVSQSPGQIHGKDIPLSVEGNYELLLQVKADAFSGGLTTTPVSYKFSYDQTPPGQVQISSATHPELLFANNRNPVFHLRAADNLSGVSGYAAVLDKVNVGDPGSDITHFGPGPEARFQVQDNGTYYLHARAIDAAGNTGPVSHYGIRVDFSGALISEAYVKALPNPVRTDVVKLEYELAAPATEVLLEFTSGQGEVVRSGEGSRTVGKNTQSWNVGDLPNGTYFFRVKAKSAEDGKSYTVNKKVALVR